MTSPEDHAPGSWRETTRVVIFEAETPAGKAFDVGLFVAIVASVGIVMLDSVRAIREAHGFALDVGEWVFTILFTIEYALRLVSVPKPLGYARSFFGIVDLLAILPTYLSLLLPGAETLLVIRGLRLLRIFRVFKLGRFLGEASLLSDAITASRHKIIVFLGTLVILVTILGATMYIVEGDENGFTSIPLAVYWAIVTMTTVGYGDIAPQTVLGKTLASIVMILGYSIIAVPTGIVTAGIVDAAAARKTITTRSCPACASEGHLPSATYCRDCGSHLDPTKVEDEGNETT